MALELNRREMMAGMLKTTAVITVSNFFTRETFAAPASGQYRDVFTTLDKFIQQYMKEMNAPGITVSIANRNGLLRSTEYGFSDVDRKTPVAGTQLFEIGSISKSFVALICLQLVEEGKLDLQKPITEYVPWFRMQSDYPVTVHHLLTHSSGLPGDPPVFLSDPAAKHEVRFVPGKAFHYCNMGFGLLGYLIETLDGTPWNESVKRRIFDPLGMSDTESRITNTNRPKIAKNYSSFLDDRPFPRMGRMSEAPAIVADFAAGSIVSTATDMAKYMTALLNKGSKITSEASFEKFSNAHIKADEFGPTASYGYGIAVDTMDGHKIIRHTGGMISFMSAIQIDLDEGVGVFASINAQQGYRPNPVCEYGLKLMRAKNSGIKLPAIPEPDDPTKIPDAKDYAGVYVAQDGSRLEFVTEPSGNGLSLLYKDKKLTIQKSTAGFIALHPDLELFAFVFGRGDKETGPATDVSHGEMFYMGSNYNGPREFQYPADWNSYTGYYRNENPWIKGFRIMKRQGKLWIEGVLLLEQLPDGRFRDASDENSPEWISFHEIVNGKAMRLKFSGEDLWRVSL